MYKNGQVCPICGSGKLEKKTVEEIFEYKGEKLVVPDYVIYECPTCEEALVDEKSVKSSQKELKDFYRKVDGLLESSEIRRIRSGIELETGTHYFVADHPLGPFEFLTDKFLVGDEVGSLYSGKVIRNPKGEWVFIAFHGYEKDKNFIGEITGPFPVTVSPNGRLKIIQSNSE